MTDSLILAATVMLASTLLVRPLEPAPRQETPDDEASVCRTAAQLEPKASVGKTARTRSALSANGELLSWDVYAVEIKESKVRRLRRQPVPNVVPVFSSPDDVSLPANSLDTAMLHDVASHVDRAARPRFYESVARALKPTGRLVIFGPHGKAKAMLDELREYGFIPLGDLKPGDLDQRLRSSTAPRPPPGSTGLKRLIRPHAPAVSLVKGPDRPIEALSGTLHCPEVAGPAGLLTHSGRGAILCPDGHPRWAHPLLFSWLVGARGAARSAGPALASPESDDRTKYLRVKSKVTSCSTFT